MNLIHVARNRQKLGEFTEAEVIEGLNTGRFLSSDIAWTPGMTDWIPLSDYKFGGTASFSSPATASAAPTPYEETPTGGIPWDDARSKYVTAWWQTTVNALISPVQTFRNAQLSGGYLRPIGYLAICSVLGCLVTTAVKSLLDLGAGAMTGTDPAAAAVSSLVALPVMAVCGIIFLPLVVAAVAFLVGGILHGLLMVLGGAKESYETTVRAYSYAGGAMHALGIIPIIGSFIALIWGPVVLAIALKEMHKTEYWKVIVAILIPIIICCGLAVVVVAAAAAGLSQGISQ